MKFRSRRRRPPQIIIISMIDVVLQLLIFFMLTTTFKASAKTTPVRVPGEAAGVSTGAVDLLAEIDGGGRLSLDGRPVPAGRTREFFSGAAGGGTDRVVVIRANRRVSHGTVLDVMGAASESGFSRIAVITGTPPPAPDESLRISAPGGPAVDTPPAVPAVPLSVEGEE